MALWKSRRLQKASSVFPASQKDKPGTPSNVPLPTASFFGGASFGDLRRSSEQKKGAPRFCSFSVHMDAGPHAGVEKDVFSGGWNSFSFVFLKKKRPKPNVEINATFPRIPNPQPDVFPPIKPPPPYTTSHHQHPPTPHLQYPSVPPAHPSCAHKVQEHEAQLEQCKATGKAEKDATKGIKDLQKNAIRVFLDPTPTSGFSKADLRNLAPPRGAGFRKSALGQFDGYQVQQHILKAKSKLAKTKLVCHAFADIEAHPPASPF